MFKKNIILTSTSYTNKEFILLKLHKLGILLLLLYILSYKTIKNKFSTIKNFLTKIFYFNS